MRNRTLVRTAAKAVLGGLLVLSLGLFSGPLVDQRGFSAAHAAAPDMSRFYVYFPLFLRSGTPLFPVEYQIPHTDAPERAALQALIAGPPEAGPLFLRLPVQTKVLESTVKDGFCTANLSKEILDLNVGAGGEAGVLSSIVNTLALWKYPPTTHVQILVEGKKLETLAGHVDITEPLEPSWDSVFKILPDVQQHWSGGAVALLQVLDIVHGYDDGTFQPEREVTRAEFVKLLTEAIQSPYVSGQAPFEDTKGHWSEPHILEAIEAGIVVPSEYGATFDPDGILPREEMAHLLARASARYREDHPEVVFDDPVEVPEISDIGSVQPEYLEGVTASVQQGLIHGYPDGTFGPKDGLKRSEACMVIARMMEMKGKKLLLLTPKRGFTWTEGNLNVYGCASAFEGNVQFRIRSGDGSEVFAGYTTSTCGMGWGIFGFSLDRTLLNGKDPAVLEVFLVSAKDGTEYSKVTVPLK